MRSREQTARKAAQSDDMTRGLGLYAEDPILAVLAAWGDNQNWIVGAAVPAVAWVGSALAQVGMSKVL